MKDIRLKKFVLASFLIAIAVVGSTFSFPVFFSRCAPVQHIVNMFAAVTLGPFYGLVIAFFSSLLRNILGLGSLMAFSGSMFGALLCGLIYKKTKNLALTGLGEVFGTSILGGLAAYPVAILLMGKSAANIAIYTYILPFFISTAGGTIIASIILARLKDSKFVREIYN
ncbi:energy coupling factor transporter S component ThiW [uncultured Anaerococcus sp.]|uniref:energy coupling factor transporter S component ThiW n=1 Tax=uncultured Anaerococcus sp. TaxID=293428 RepID=UPI0026129D01|nr:energy coupling factor transporter S component ThiW [uncultured Anaerococcus sp.]